MFAFRALLALVLVLAALVVIVRLIEPRLAFFPTSGETATPRDFGLDYEAFTISTRDGERLLGWMLPVREPRALIVYFHGNGGNLSNSAPILARLAEQRYFVLAFDYRGYGLSTGRPPERGLYRDVDGVLDHMRKIPKRDITVVYWGRSLGATMAAYAASKEPPDGLILESGFPDARSLLRASPPMAFLALFSTYRFSTIEFLRRVRVPSLVMHGDADRVVSFEYGRRLFAQIDGPKQFVAIRGGGHNDASPSNPNTYWPAVNAFVKGLREQP